ncbi:hypothetical protein L1987_60838 [Smallanthus sonchifolius]|uniref:Uncharacterized protein n=1 Tax=Smallanthus sonchifolius TaxID=185202 RepID=A0ACB9D9J0_9ASTR|nr:hypothetical protein L1987_60838 [Smallanthus sonchifolius]
MFVEIVQMLRLRVGQIIGGKKGKIWCLCYLFVSSKDEASEVWDGALIWTWQGVERWEARGARTVDSLSLHRRSALNLENGEEYWKVKM